MPVSYLPVYVPVSYLPVYVPVSYLPVYVPVSYLPVYVPVSYLPVPPQSSSWEVRISEVPLASPVLKPHCCHVAKVTPHFLHLLDGPQDIIRPSLKPQHCSKPHPLGQGVHPTRVQSIGLNQVQWGTSCIGGPSIYKARGKEGGHLYLTLGLLLLFIHVSDASNT